VELVGREEELTEAEMQAFTDFVIQLGYPPNPNRPLSNTLTDDMSEGRRVYMTLATSGNSRSEDGRIPGCNTCHVLRPQDGYYGTALNRTAVLGTNSQDYKVPHFRNLYQKVGLFRGGSQEQVRGFGFSQNGATANLMALLNAGDFTFETSRQAEQLAAFLFAFDTLLTPIVGQQVTLSADSPESATQRLDLLFTRAQVLGLVPECDLVVRGSWEGERRGAIRLEDDSFQSDRRGEVYQLADLRELAREPGNHLTFTCVPPNSGIRIGIDENLNAVLNADESLL
jgi:hypothetical protein